MLACYVCSAVANYGLAALMVRISQKIVYTMRRQLFEKLTTLPVNFFDTTATGDTTESSTGEGSTTGTGTTPTEMPPDNDENGDNDDYIGN
jgi:ATP-binding cassette subfamily B protein